MASVEAVLKTARSQLGVRENPWGSNDGPQVRKYTAVTGQHRAPWCVSFIQWVLKQNKLGPIADNTAGVFYLESYARRRGWIVKSPKPGDLVCFMTGQGHIGIVDTVNGSGTTFTTIEGNAGNGVTRRYHWARTTNHFVRVPGMTSKPVYVRVARFRLVHKNGKPVTIWQKWINLKDRLPTLLAKNKNELKVQRKIVRVKKG